MCLYLFVTHIAVIIPTGPDILITGLYMDMDFHWRFEIAVHLGLTSSPGQWIWPWLMDQCPWNHRGLPLSVLLYMYDCSLFFLNMHNSYILILYAYYCNAVRIHNFYMTWNSLVNTPFPIGEPTALVHSACQPCGNRVLVEDNEIFILQIHLWIGKKKQYQHNSLPLNSCQSVLVQFSSNTGTKLGFN